MRIKLPWCVSLLAGFARTCLNPSLPILLSVPLPKQMGDPPPSPANPAPDPSIVPPTMVREDGGTTNGMATTTAVTVTVRHPS